MKFWYFNLLVLALSPSILLAADVTWLAPSDLRAASELIVRGNDSIKEGRPDTHAPAHLLGDHVHHTGEWMVEYKYTQMYMDGNRTGTTRLTDLEALNYKGVGMPPAAFGATPTQMTMDMHMLHIMYGVNDNVTAYIMPMWMSNTMDHARRPGFPNNNFTVNNSGFSDLGFGALWRIYEGCTDDLILNIGFTAPTGDIDNTTAVPTGVPDEFPYPMRLGSGTWNARPGITYKQYWERSSLGLQFQTDLPMGLNDARYRRGNEYRANAWYAHLFGCEDQFAATFRVEGLWRSNYVGADTRFNIPGLISTIDPDMRGGELLNFGYGLIWKLPGGGRLNAELTHPIYQRLRGVQLETDWTLAASYSKAF